MPRRRALGALNFAVAAGGAAALIGSVVYVCERSGLGESELVLTMAAWAWTRRAEGFGAPELVEYIECRTQTGRGASIGVRRRSGGLVESRGTGHGGYPCGGI